MIKVVTFAFFCSSVLPLSAQWARTYGTPADENLIDIAPAVGGGYFLVSSEAGTANGKILVIKIRDDGRILWQKSFADTFQTSSPQSLWATPDGGFILVGVSGRLSIFKVNGNGILEWQRTYAGNPAPDPPVLLNGFGGFHIIGSRDGGYLVAGYDNYYWSHYGMSFSKPILLKINAAGSIEWSRYYGFNFGPSAIVQTSDGGYIWTGWHGINFFNPYQQQATLVKINGAGGVQWIKSYGNGGISSLARLSGGDLLAKVSFGFLGNAGGYAILIFNENGDVVWQNEVVETYFSCEPTPDGGFFLTTRQAGRFAVSKFDAQRTLVWTKSYPNGQLIRSGNDASHLIGWSGVRPGALRTDLLLSKIGLDGASGLSCFRDEDAVIPLSQFPALTTVQEDLTAEDVPVFSTPAGLLVQGGGANTGFLCGDVDAPVLSVWPKRMTFGGVLRGSAGVTQELLIENSGAGLLTWAIQPSAPWIVCRPLSGTGVKIASVSIDISSLSPGRYVGRLQILADGAENSPQETVVDLEVYDEGATSGPIGYFDTPPSGETVSSSVAVTGWALDDIGIATVKIYRDPVGDEQGRWNGWIYIGDAVFVPGARPDVETAFPDYPRADRAGWGYMMLTNFLPDGGNGMFTIHAVATDLDGHSAFLGTKTITCDNANAVKPFGAIDTPTQGGTASGSLYYNFGWALTPQPKFIPTDGSTIWVFVDGVPLGHPSYNHFRDDIAALFPGYANSNGAIGYWPIDTTAYANGLHTIAWSVTDSEGQTGGIGSRFFNIVNEGTRAMPGHSRLPSPMKADGLARLFVENRFPVFVRKGFDPKTPVELFYPDDGGAVRLDIAETERLEIRFDLPGGSRGGSCAGYLRVGENLRPLPVGSTLDRENGMFVWQPGPGFVGEYRFVFYVTANGLARIIPVNVSIEPAALAGGRRESRSTRR